MIRVSVFADEVSKDFEEAVRQSVEAGARGIELRGGIWGRNVVNCTDDDVARVIEVLDKYEARVVAIGSPVGKCHLGNDEEYEAHLRHFDRACALAHALGTDIVRGFAFWNPHREERQRPDLSLYLDDMAAKLKPIVAKAEQEGVYYCLEPEGSTMTGTCAEVRAVLDALGNSPALGVAWDIRNGLTAGEMPYPDGYSLIRGRVRHLHIKPNPQRSVETIGNSQLTYLEVFRALEADGFEGWASIEHWGSPEAMLDGVRQLDKLLGELTGTA